MNFARHLALTAILLAGSAAAWADEAADTFNKLYADDLKRVAATPSPADDVALARQLLEAAGKVANQKALLTLLCEKAYGLAIKDPTGYPTAKAARELLAAGAAEKKVESTLAEKQIAALKARLSVDPRDASSRKEIVRLYLVEMDNPAEAAKFLDEAMDAATRKYVPAAAKPIEDAPEAACTEMGDWYKGLADQATAPASKGAMLQRAKAYYARFADLHKADDVARAGATLMLMKIDDTLAKLGPAVVGMPGSSSLTLGLGRTPLPAPLLKGLVLFYTFDRNEGSKVTDKSGCGNHGKVQGAQWTSEGKVAGAYRFEAAKKTQGILVPNTESLGVKRLTMAAWIRTTQQDGTWARIMDKDYRNGYNLRLGGDYRGRQSRGQAGVEINNHTVSTGRVADGQWHHILATYDGQVQRLYIDAKPVGQKAWAGDIGLNPYDLTVGNSSIPYGDVGLLAFDGLIDEVMIWNRALSEEEVQQVYSATGGK